MTDSKSNMKSLMAYEKIRDMILSGFKLPGTRLILSDLEQELGIGRGPVREAIMRLDRSGLVKNIPYKGAIVAAPPSQKEILYIYELRVELEVKLALEAIPNLTEGHFLSLEKLMASMEELPGNHHQYDREFHYLIYDSSNLHHLCNIAQAMRFSIESVLNAYRWDKDFCRQFNKEHREIFNALKDRNPERVKKELTINIKSGLRIVEETFNRISRIPFK